MYLADISDDPRERPINSKELSQILEEDPSIYKQLAALCLLSVSGVSDKFKEAYKKQLDSFFGSEVDLALKKRKYHTDIFMDHDYGAWTYVVSYFDSFVHFLDTEGKINLVCIN